MDSLVTRSELITILAPRFPTLRPQDVADSVAILIDTIKATLAAGDRVEIRGFGSFSVAYRGPRIGRNPATGERIQVRGKWVPHFKAGKELAQRANRSR